MIKPKYEIFFINKSNVVSSEYSNTYDPLFKDRYVLDQPQSYGLCGYFDSVDEALLAIQEHNSKSKDYFVEKFTILPVYKIDYEGKINNYED